MESEDIEAALRQELNRSGRRWAQVYAKMGSKRQFELLGQILARKRVEEIAEKRYAKLRPNHRDDFYEGDPEIMETQGPLGHTTGGGKRNVRSTKPMS